MLNQFRDILAYAIIVDYIVGDESSLCNLDSSTLHIPHEVYI